MRVGASAHEYQTVADDERGRPRTPRALQIVRGSRLQWFLLFMLTLFASVVLVDHTRKWQKQAAANAEALERYEALMVGRDGPYAKGRGGLRRRGKGKGWSPFSLGMGAAGRMGVSSAFALRRKQAKKQARATAKASTKSVLLIGSHHAPGNELLKALFTRLCQMPRLNLKCEPTWGGTHDLKKLTASRGQGRRRLVWLEGDATELLRTLRGVRTHASSFRLLHLLWDPARACIAAMAAPPAADDSDDPGYYGAGSRLLSEPVRRGIAPPLLRPKRDKAANKAKRAAALAAGTLAPPSNVSLSGRCDGIGLEAAGHLYKRARRDKAHVLQVRLEALVSKKKTAAASWRQLFKFVELAEQGGDLTATAQEVVKQLELRKRVLNRGAPAWARDAAGASNATLRAWLKKVRTDSDYGVRGQAQGLAAFVPPEGVAVGRIR